MKKRIAAAILIPSVMILALIGARSIFRQSAAPAEEAKESRPVQMAPVTTAPVEEEEAEEEEACGGITPVIYWAVRDNTGELVLASQPLEGTASGSISGTEDNFFACEAAWYQYRDMIKSVRIADRISPCYTTNWFNQVSHIRRFRQLENLDMSNCVHAERMFQSLTELKELDLSSFDTSSCTSMYGMFCGCSALEKLDLSSFDTSKVRDMGIMFNRCTSLKELSLSAFDTRNVENMEAMFNDCVKLCIVTAPTFDMSNVRTKDYMFCNCVSLEEEKESGIPGMLALAAAPMAVR